MTSLDRAQVLAFRIAGHHLDRRRPVAEMAEVVGACGLQNTPPGSAVVGMQARLGGLTPEAVKRALEVEKTLLQVWSVRSAPYLVPTEDLPVFTVGLLPPDEASLRVFIASLVPVLDEFELSATDAVERAAKALEELLDGRVLTKREMGVALARYMPDELGPWFAPDVFSDFTDTIARPIALSGLFVFAPRRGNKSSFVRTDQWLGRPPPAADPAAARAELTRRYLRCYGPSTAEHLAEWAGIAPEQAALMWRLVSDELVPAGDGWVLAADADRLASPPQPAGVRLLPPYDAYLQQRDRFTLVTHRPLHRVVWRATGNPGAVLADGEVVATWRAQRKGRRLALAIESFWGLRHLPAQAVQAEAEAMATVRGCTSVELTVR